MSEGRAGVGGSTAAAAGVLAAASRQLWGRRQCGHGGLGAGCGSGLGQASAHAKTLRAGCAAAATRSGGGDRHDGDGVGAGGPCATPPPAVAPLRAWTDAGAPGPAIRGGRLVVAAAACLCCLPPPWPCPSLPPPCVRYPSAAVGGARRGGVWCLHELGGRRCIGAWAPTRGRADPLSVGPPGWGCLTVLVAVAARVRLRGAAVRPFDAGWCSLADVSLYHIYSTVSLAFGCVCASAGGGDLFFFG